MSLNKYIGIPFKGNGRDFEGVDCWGLVRLFYQYEKKIILESYSDEYKDVNDLKRLSELIITNKVKWNLVTDGAEKIGDVLLIRIKGFPVHVGVIVKKKHMLHVMEGINSVMVPYTSMMWRSRILGIYAYEK